MKTQSKRRAPIEARLNFRLHPDIKARVERAAALSGQTLTDFATNAVLEKAAGVILRETTIDLGEEDRKFFFALLDADSKPSIKSKAAAARYRKGHYDGNGYHW
jgi:uncharacterized protein (DUF1778 family)